MSVTAERLEEGLWIAMVALTASAPAAPPADLHITWNLPIIDLCGLWNTNSRTNRSLHLDGAAKLLSRATIEAPVVCAFSESGQNRHTFACSDALHTVQSRVAVGGHSMLECTVHPFRGPRQPALRHELKLRLDTRDVPYQQALADVADWWAAQEGYRPAAVPEHARLPMYSTWYSYLQKLDIADILRQCRLAKQIGCESIIVDDGWQPVDEVMGYRHCGDWEPANVPDMPGFVRGCQDAGLKFLLWYGTPLIGHASKAYQKYKHQMLYDLPWTPCSVFDPRFPEIRNHLIGKLEQQTRDWGLDGLKLDFVDLFIPPDKPHPLASTTGRDFDGVPEAGDYLLTQIMTRLLAIRPDIMIEFRQPYVGPLMRKYGNMLRAADCPDCTTSNRSRTLDVRLLAGSTPAHSDMIEWHPDSPVEVAAMQLLHVLFSVPQISVLLDRLPSSHVEMLRFWLRFWRENRDVLLDGRLEPLSPHWLYPVVRASTSQKRILAIYADSLADVGPDVPDTLLIVNGRPRPSVIVALPQDLPPRRLRAFDTTGRCVADQRVQLPKGIHRLDVPAAGLIRIEND